MNPPAPAIRPATSDDLDSIVRLTTQGFNTPSVWQQRLREEFDVERWRVAELDGSVAGTTRTFAFAHYFGGRPVPAAAVSSVAVAAEARGRGIATALMRAALTEQRATGYSISSLYPATVPVYARVRYGFGGVRTRWKASLRELPARPRSAAEIAPFDFSALDEIDECYAKIASQTNGLIARDREWWERRVLRPMSDSPMYSYVARESGRVTGWIVYEASRPARDAWRFTMVCRDLFWTTPDAARALLDLAALHRSTASGIEWLGPPVEPLGDLTGEDAVEHAGAFRWMVRIVDVPAAIEARGYNPLAAARVTIRARDPLFPDNEGPWEIEVSGGRAKVSPSGTADATADVATWASIWTNHIGARDAVRTGGLVATPDALDALDLIFAGPSPWIADFY